MPDPQRPARGANYLKYSGLAVQIALTIFLAGYLGQQIDRRTGQSRPYFTLLLSLFGLAGSLIYLIRKVGKDS